MNETHGERDDALSVEHRAALAAWADHPAPDGFADLVVEKLGRDQTSASEHDDAEQEPHVRTNLVLELERARRRRRSVIAVACALAAAVLIGYWVRGLAIDNREYEQKIARQNAPQLEATSELAGLRADAHDTFARHCTPCHDSSDDAAKGDAINVFDVQDRRWWLSMSDRQLEVAVARMASEHDVQPEERRGIAAYVEAELAFRSVPAGGSS